MKELCKKVAEPCSKLKAVVASSQDFDQSIYQTLKPDLATFWSSSGSLTKDATEFLVYEMPQRMLVNSVLVRSFNPS